MTGAEPPAPPAAAEPVMLDSSTLLGDAREVAIRHGAEIYRLRLTRHDRLILTK